MPKQLTLPADIDAPAQARRWVRGRLLELGRPELVEAASLGVSELVTNALLHAGGGIGVRVADTNGKIRVEVYDESPTVPERTTGVGLDLDTNPSTVGRGLQIVEAISLAWGVYDEQFGKCVWFQPTAEGLPMRNGNGGPLMDTAPHPAAPVVVDEEQVTVHLIGLPVVLFAHYRTRLHDLRRELTLISLDDSQGSEVGTRLIAAARHHDHRVHHADMIAHIDDAITAGLERSDVTVSLPRSVLAELVLLRDVLRELEDFTVARHLLTLAPGPQERAIWEWYFQQVLGQAEGAAPTPWPGGYQITDPNPLAD